MLHFRSLRFRIGAAFILGSLVVGMLVAGSTYALVRRQLTRERVGAAENQTWSKLRQVVDYLETAPGPTVRSPEILDLIRERGPVIIVTNDSAQESDAKFRLRDIPLELREAIDGGDVAYVLAGRRMIIGTRIPGAENDGQVYFEYRIGALVRTLNTLLRSLVAVVAASVLVAGVFGLRLASATIRPLRLAANAARGIAEGNLNTRLDVRGGDELGQLATAFNQMTAALEERMARERRFVADVSHELRTPLTTLKTSIDFLVQRTDELPAPMQRMTGLAAREVRALQRLVDDLLELSRMEAGGVTAEQDEVDLVDFANEVIGRRAPGADVTVIAPPELVIRTDKMRLERIVGNLLENAVFHGGPGGVELRLEQSNGEAKIVVSDRGPGIDEEKLPMIFERFWRGDESRQRSERTGSGLGLSIARENALLIGAGIEVASEPGRGTSFEVRIPTSEHGT